MEQTFLGYTHDPLILLIFFNIRFSFNCSFNLSVLLKIVISLDFRTLSGLVYEYKKFRAFKKVIFIIQVSKISRKCKTQILGNPKNVKCL